MKLTKLTALTFVLSFFLFIISSCEPNAEKKKTTDFQKTGIVMSGSNEIPGNPSPAIGKLDVFYTRETRILSYTVTWSGLTDSVMLMHIHGLAPLGYAAGVVQNIVTPSNSIYPQKTAGKYTYAKSGSLTGTCLIDGVIIKEADLLNGMYYMNIHTTNYPGGEIRGQIVFQ